MAVFQFYTNLGNWGNFDGIVASGCRKPDGLILMLVFSSVLCENRNAVLILWSEAYVN